MRFVSLASIITAIEPASWRSALPGTVRELALPTQKPFRIPSLFRALSILLLAGSVTVAVAEEIRLQPAAAWSSLMRPALASMAVA